MSLIGRHEDCRYYPRELMAHSTSAALNYGLKRKYAVCTEPSRNVISTALQLRHPEFVGQL